MASKTGCTSGLRLSDGPQDLTGRGLLVQGLSDVRVGLRRSSGSVYLQLGEQANVLDGDDGLGGERLEQSNLAITERSRLTSGDGDRPDHAAFVQHRHDQHASIAPGTRDLSSRGPHSWIGIGIARNARDPVTNHLREERVISQRQLP